MSSPPPRLRALIYNRVSADPSGRRISTTSQDVENRAFCAQQGWDVIATITDDDRSASRFASRSREGYERVQQALDGQLYGRVDILVTWESSRGERRLDGYVNLRDRLERNNVLLAYKGRTFDMREGDDRFITGLDALLDEREAERARERTLRSHRDSAMRGTPRGVTPYGFERRYDPHSGRMLEQLIHPETGPIVQEIVSRIIAGDTLYRVAQDLNRRSILTPRGFRDKQAGRGEDRAGWSSSMIRNLLGKQSLMGVRTHHGAAVGDATWPALIEPADWATVQQILADPARARANGGVEVRYLLSGIARCAVCQAWMRPLTNRGRSTYVCAGRVPSAGKGHVSRGRRDLDAMVTAIVVNLLADPQIVERAAQLQGRNVTARGEADRELANLEARAAEHEAALRNVDGPPSGRVIAILDDLDKQIQGVKDRRAATSGLPAIVLEAAGPDAAQTWNEHADDLPWQRQVVKSLVHVWVNRTSRPGLREFEEDTVDVVPIAHLS